MPRASALLLALFVAACGAKEGTAARACPLQPGGEVVLAGGVFTFGAAPMHPEEGPPRTVTVGRFAIDRTEVTNADFAAFVAATGHVTLAERPPDRSSPVFSAEIGDWRVMAGAGWRHPQGPRSTIRARERDPVVHVGYPDALAYARWRGRDLPTEAEWEFAARAGLENARYEWGDDPAPDGGPRANHWQGVFPVVDTGEDGFKGRAAPVGCFPASRYGLHDMTGNVWEWTRPEGDAPPVIKGGSFLCADNFCLRYRPAARQTGPDDSGASHIGFRTVRRIAGGEP